MNSSAHVSLGASSNAQPINNSIFNGKTLVFAIVIILGIGALVVAGVGLGGLGAHQMWWAAGALSQLGQINSIIMISAGGALGVTLLVMGIIGSVRNHHKIKSSKNIQPAPSAPALPPPVVFNRKQVFISRTGDGTIRNDIYFGSMDWKLRFDLNVESVSIPQLLIEALETPCPYSNDPAVKTKETHMLVLIPGGLSLDLLQDLMKNSKVGNKATYRIYDSEIQANLGAKPVKETHWILMARDVTPGSSFKPSYSEQRKLVKAAEGYRVPTALEAATAMMVEFNDSGTHLFGTNPPIFTHCREKINGVHVKVGNFGEEGLDIVLQPSMLHASIGMSGMLRG